MASDSVEMLTISIPRNEVEILHSVLVRPPSYWRDLVEHLLGRQPILPQQSLALRLHKALRDTQIRNGL